VVGATAEATGTILDAPGAGAARRRGAGGHREKIRVLSTRIFEACNFQNVTGQRITKVVARAQAHRAQGRRRAGGIRRGYATEGAQARRGGAAAPDDESKLLNGPQLADAQHQDDIDALFASLK